MHTARQPPKTDKKAPAVAGASTCRKSPAKAGHLRQATCGRVIVARGGNPDVFPARRRASCHTLPLPPLSFSTVSSSGSRRSFSMSGAFICYAGNRSIFPTAYCRIRRASVVSTAGAYPPQQKRRSVFESPYRGNKPFVPDSCCCDSACCLQGFLRFSYQPETVRFSQPHIAESDEHPSYPRRGHIPRSKNAEAFLNPPIEEISLLCPIAAAVILPVVYKAFSGSVINRKPFDFPNRILQNQTSTRRIHFAVAADPAGQRISSLSASVSAVYASVVTVSGMTSSRRAPPAPKAAPPMRVIFAGTA